MNTQSEHFLDDLISKMKNIIGIDTVYFLDENKNLLKEFHYNGQGNHLAQIQELFQLQPISNSLSSSFFQSELHTKYFLNEDGLIIISKLGSNLYLVIVAGENQPADLLNLLKICKESRSNYESYLQQAN